MSVLNVLFTFAFVCACLDTHRLLGSPMVGESGMVSVPAELVAAIASGEASMEHLQALAQIAQRAGTCVHDWHLTFMCCHRCWDVSYQVS